MGEVSWWLGLMGDKKILQYSRKKGIAKLPNSVVISKAEELTFDIISPNLYGAKNVIVLEPSNDDYKLINDMELPDYLNLTFYLSRDLYSKVSKEAKPSKYKEFVGMVNSEVDNLSKKFIFELYTRTDGDFEKAREILNTGIRTVSSLNRVLEQKKNKVYASDVMSSALKTSIYKCSGIGRDLEAATLSMLLELTKEIGEEIAFYALRKNVDNLLKMKNMKLLNKPLTGVKSNFYIEKIVEEISITQLILAYNLFLYSKPHEIVRVIKKIMEPDPNSFYDKLREELQYNDILF